MFKRLFRRSGKINRIITDEIYAQIVAAARQPLFYSHFGVPDTPLGRFEMLSLHMFLFLHRMRGHEGATADLAQDVTDVFFLDVDHSLRELGIGDIGIPKRMKKLAKMFYGRAASYGRAVDEKDEDALAKALARNIRPEESVWPESSNLAQYVMAAHAKLRAQLNEEFLKGNMPDLGDGPIER